MIKERSEKFKAVYEVIIKKIRELILEDETAMPLSGLASYVFHQRIRLNILLLLCVLIRLIDIEEEGELG